MPRRADFQGGLVVDGGPVEGGTIAEVDSFGAALPYCGEGDAGGPVQMRAAMHVADALAGARSDA